MPARYIISSIAFIHSINRHVVVIEFWVGSKKVDVSYQDPKNSEIIRELKTLFINKGIGAVKDYQWKKWKMNRKTVDTTV